MWALKSSTRKSEISDSWITCDHQPCKHTRPSEKGTLCRSTVLEDYSAVFLCYCAGIVPSSSYIIPVLKNHEKHWHKLVENNMTHTTKQHLAIIDYLKCTRVPMKNKPLAQSGKHILVSHFNPAFRHNSRVLRPINPKFWTEHVEERMILW